MIEPTLNQYAAPTAAVADVSPETTGTSELDYFSAKGRIGRLRYLAWVTGASLIQGLVAGVFTFVLPGAVLPMILNVVLYIAMLWFSIVTGIKRCHDVNISGWWSATVIIPVIALVWVFWPGTKGANRFGPPPPPNTLGVKLLGLIMPVVMIIGIVAAISIPAYSAYMKKARAAEASYQQQR